jgi:hypothetical protein
MDHELIAELETIRSELSELVGRISEVKERLSSRGSAPDEPKVASCCEDGACSGTAWVPQKNNCGRGMQCKDVNDEGHAAELTMCQDSPTHRASYAHLPPERGTQSARSYTTAGSLAPSFAVLLAFVFPSSRSPSAARARRAS